MRRRNPKSLTWWILGGVALAGIGLIIFHPGSPATTGSADQRSPKTFTPPSDSWQLMLNAWAANGRPVDRDRWVHAMLPIFPGAVSIDQWAWIYDQARGQALIGNFSGYNEAYIEHLLNQAVNGAS